MEMPELAGGELLGVVMVARPGRALRGVLDVLWPQLIKSQPMEHLWNTLPSSPTFFITTYGTPINSTRTPITRL